MHGRTALITGGTCGIGRATAMGLGRLGANVAITGRDAVRAEEAAQEIREATGATVLVFLADLSSQAEVRRLAAEALDRLPTIDVLVNNVGGYWDTRQLTVDGIERTLAVNHLAPFLLTELMLARLKRSAYARVVTVASQAHTQGWIDFDDLQGERSYSGARAYSQSKLANVLFTHELARRQPRVTANAVHPGEVSTAFGAEDPGRTQRLLVPVLRPLMKSPARGAATSIYAATAPELVDSTGGYLANSKARPSAALSYNQELASRLWRVSEDLVAEG
ncbi:SDR family oxidoreductase [Nocardioides sp. NPDC000445]|uniref:SDR family oxidoreductase n=1 Tax=Nocardioides sp. NPDC000445 TaxID=3154257 RepID=UPI003318C5B4